MFIKRITFQIFARLFSALDSCSCSFLDSVSKYWAFKSLTTRLSLRWVCRLWDTIYFLVGTRDSIQTGLYNFFKKFHSGLCLVYMYYVCISELRRAQKIGKCKLEAIDFLYQTYLQIVKSASRVIKQYQAGPNFMDLYIMVT